MASLAVGGHWLWASLRTGSAQLVIHPTGAVRYRETGGAVTWKGHLEPSAWERRHVAVVILSLAFGRLSLPIFRHRQAPGEFRRLRVHLRHRRSVSEIRFS